MQCICVQELRCNALYTPISFHALNTFKMLKTIPVPHCGIVRYLSILNNNLIIGGHVSRSVQIYDMDKKEIQTINSSVNVFDAAWINADRILCTTNVNEKKIVVITLSGEIISEFPLAANRRISACNSTLYVASGTEGVYHSTDGGLSWTMLFLPLPNQSSEMKLWQVIKVNGGENDEAIFWATVDSTLKTFMYNSVIHSLKWKTVNIKNSSGEQVLLNSHSVLVYDGNDSVFVSVPSQNAIYVFSVKKCSQQCILSSSIGINCPYALALDVGRGLLYVGERKQIKVFQFPSRSSRFYELNIDLSIT